MYRRMEEHTETMQQRMAEERQLVRKENDEERAHLNAKVNHTTTVIQIITSVVFLTLSSLTLHCHLHPLLAANCCRNSRLVVDEYDLMRVKK